MTSATPSNIINTNNLPNSFRISLRSVIISPYSLIVNLQCKPERDLRVSMVNDAQMFVKELLATYIAMAQFNHGRYAHMM